MIELAGNRVVLRSLTLEHVDALAKEGDRRERMRRQVERNPTLDDGGYLGLAILADGAVVGGIEARAPKHGFPRGTCEIGITLLPDARGRGFGLEAVTLLTEYLLQETMERVQASTAVDNIAMRRVLERAGYEYEGVLRSYAPGDAGREDYALYAAIRG